MLVSCNPSPGFYSRPKIRESSNYLHSMKLFLPLLLATQSAGAKECISANEQPYRHAVSWKGFPTTTRFIIERYGPLFHMRENQCKCISKERKFFIVHDLYFEFMRFKFSEKKNPADLILD